MMSRHSEPVPSPRRALVGLFPKLQYETLQISGVWSIFRMFSPPTEDFLVTVLSRTRMREKDSNSKKKCHCRRIQKKTKKRRYRRILLQMITLSIERNPFPANSQTQNVFKLQLVTITIYFFM